MSAAARSIFIDLLVHGRRSRAEIARRLDLSPSVLTKLTRPLLAAGYLRELPEYSNGALGRPAVPLDVNHGRETFVGIKLTADRLFAVRTDLGARIQDAVELALPEHEVADVVRQVAAAVEALTPAAGSAASARPAALGVSLAGTVSRADPIVHRSPFLGWREVPLAALVAEATGMPTILENDVRALTAAEHWFGAAVGLSSFALVTVGAGIGCGIVVNDDTVSGLGGASGQLGHTAIDDRGPRCELGHRGCARAYAAMPYIRRSVRNALERPELEFDDCVDLARRGDPVAAAIFAEAGRALGRVVATITNLIGPQAVLLSGEAVHMYEVCADAFTAALAAHTHWTLEPVEVLVRPFEFTEWARGAAVVALRHRLRA